MKHFVWLMMLFLWSATTPLLHAKSPILHSKVYEAKEFPISIASGDQLNPDVVWDGTNFWVVWVSDQGDNVAKITPDGVVDTTFKIHSGVIPSIAFGDSKYCVLSNITQSLSAKHIEFCIFRENGEIMVRDTIYGRCATDIDGNPTDGILYMDDKTAIPVFGRNHFFFFTQIEWVHPMETTFYCKIFGSEEDSNNIVDIAHTGGPYSQAITGIWNGEKFFSIWAQCSYQLSTGIFGGFLEDSLLEREQRTDILQFKIRDENELMLPEYYPYWAIYSSRNNELAWSGSRYLLISETGANWGEYSKIWFDVLSDSGLPIDSLPTIIDNGDSVHQTYPTCTHKDDKFFAVWQDSSNGWSRLYGIEIDTLGEIGFSSYLSGMSNKIQPSIISGGDKLLLVWADNRNGDFDIYGMILDSLVGVEERDCFADARNDKLQVGPNPFNQVTVISYQLSEFSTQNSQLTTLKIYDLSGRLIRQFPIHNLQPTSNEIIWNAKDDKGNQVSPGVYFCILSNDKHRKVEKLILLR